MMNFAPLSVPVLSRPARVPLSCRYLPTTEPEPVRRVARCRSGTAVMAQTEVYASCANGAI